MFICFRDFSKEGNPPVSLPAPDISQITGTPAPESDMPEDGAEPFDPDPTDEMLPDEVPEDIPAEDAAELPQ